MRMTNNIINDTTNNITDSLTNKELIQKAKEALGNSYAPYSGFKVGAAVLTQDNTVFTGCNIENASFGATNCAERTAIFNAVSNGHKKIKKIAIASSKDTQTYPCGICRQVMLEFMDENAVIILNEKDTIFEYTLKEMLPCAFKEY